LVDLETPDKQLCEGVNLLTKDYPDDVDINLWEIKYFYIYIKQSKSDE